MPSLLPQIAYGITLLLVVACWFVGMRSYMRLANAAGVSFMEAFYTFRVYGYAFKEARGSRDTRLMVGGFVAMMLSLGLGISILGFIA